MKYLILPVAFIGFFLFVPNVHAATFFIDSDCGTPGNGSLAACTGAGTDSFDDTLDFTETGRNDGDVGIHRRGTTALYDDGTDLQFTSDGSLVNPIFLEADYGDAWGDFASSTETATLTFGSSTITMSASSTEIQVGKWIWAIGDDNKEFSYEVKSVTSATVVLFLPYKGGQAGSGVGIEVMPAAPIWGTAVTAIQWNFDGDDHWKVQGIHIRGTDANGNVEIDGSNIIYLKDVILEGNGSGDLGTRTSSIPSSLTLFKVRTFKHNTSVAINAGVSGGLTFVFSSLFDVNSVAGGECFQVDVALSLIVVQAECKDAAELIETGGQRESMRGVFRNVVSNATNVHDLLVANIARTTFLQEDFNGTIGDSRVFGQFSTDANTPIYQSDTGTTRSGGSNISIKVTPNTSLSTAWEESRVKLLEIPFFATTSSKKYEVFFRPTATSDWTADPTATELWCELEAWGSAVADGNFRQITKSTETISMTGSTTFTALSVTYAPAQAGVAYLRCYYAKTKESAKANTFFVDPIPVVT